MAIGGSSSIQILIAVAIVGLFGIITFAITAATLGTLNKRYNDLSEQIVNLENKISTTTPTPIPTPATTGSTNSSTATANTNTTQATAYMTTNSQDDNTTS